MNIKARFPNETTLRETITERLPDLLVIIQKRLGGLEGAYKIALRKVGYGSALVVVGVLVGRLGVELGSALLVISSLLLGAFVLYVGARMVWRAGQVIKQFNAELDAIVFPLVADVLGLGNGAQHFEHGNATRRLSWQSLFASIREAHADQTVLDRSQLITEPHNFVYGDDVLVCDVDGRSLSVQELDVRHVTGSGKNRHTKYIFSGYLVSFPLLTMLKGMTFVSTEGDDDGFGHQTFWSNMVGDRIKTTELEWSDFENKLHVTTTDPVEARYVLTPDLMQDLYDWWQQQTGNIRLSFIGETVYLLYPSKQIRVGRTLHNLSESQVQAYLESIALPLLHVLYLIEDVAQRFQR